MHAVRKQVFRYTLTRSPSALPDRQSAPQCRSDPGSGGVKNAVRTGVGGLRTYTTRGFVGARQHE